MVDSRESNVCKGNNKLKSKKKMTSINKQQSLCKKMYLEVYKLDIISISELNIQVQEQVEEYINVQYIKHYIQFYNYFNLCTICCFIFGILGVSGNIIILGASGIFILLLNMAFCLICVVYLKRKHRKQEHIMRTENIQNHTTHEYSSEPEEHENTYEEIDETVLTGEILVLVTDGASNRSSTSNTSGYENLPEDYLNPYQPIVDETDARCYTNLTSPQITKTTCDRPLN